MVPGAEKIRHLVSARFWSKVGNDQERREQPARTGLCAFPVLFPVPRFETVDALLQPAGTFWAGTGVVTSHLRLLTTARPRKIPPCGLRV